MIPSHLINPNKILYQFGGRKCISEKFKEIHYYENSPDKDVYFEMDSIIFVDLFYIKDLHILNKLKFKDNIFIFNNIHLFPEIIKAGNRTTWTSVFILVGIFFGLITEKVIHRNHCHMPITKEHVHPFAIMNLI